MTALPAARELDIVKHTSKLLGFFAGAVAAVAIGLFVAGTGGLGAAAVAGLALGGGAVGCGIAAGIDAFMDNPGVTTGALGKGSVHVTINGLDAAAVLDRTPCYFPIVYNHGDQAIVEGSKTVFFACRPAARKGDALMCDGRIAKGSPNVFIGGPPVRVKGTKRSWFDTLLDYASIYMLVAFAGQTVAGFAVSAAIVGIFEVAGAHSAAPTVLGGAGSSLADNASIALFNQTAEQLATSQHLAREAAESSAMYSRYVNGKISKGLPWLAKSEWLKNPRVAWALNRRVPPRAPPTPKSGGSWKATGGKIVAALGVDALRAWRNAQREEALPSEVCCEDTSWLEPA